jgi:hypothetical protein
MAHLGSRYHGEAMSNTVTTSMAGAFVCWASVCGHQRTHPVIHSTSLLWMALIRESVLRLGARSWSIAPKRRFWASGSWTRASHERVKSQGASDVPRSRVQGKVTAYFPLG